MIPSLLSHARRLRPCGAVIATLALILTAPAPAGAGGEAGKAAKVTAPFREEHAGIREHLGHLHEKAGALRAEDAEQQKASMRFVTGFFKDHIRPHAEWEEKVLYPAVDRLAKSGKEPFTATMRHEHRIVGRWIDELDAESTKPAPDVEAFARRTDNLLGLLSAHFEEEEEVLLPLIDAQMTPAQFQREIADKMEKHE